MHHRRPCATQRGRKAKAALVEDDPVPQYNAANNTSIIKAGAPAFGCTVHLLCLQAPSAAYAHKSPGQQQV